MHPAGIEPATCGFEGHNALKGITHYFTSFLSFQRTQCSLGAKVVPKHPDPP